ncbi:MAG: 1-acyl-sn-glycerol-3-phosphate acyltransferase, partial [Acidobacteriota bacterium]
MFRILRAAFRLVAFLLATLLIQTAWLIGKALLPAKSVARRSFRKFIFISWARSLAVIVGMRVRIVGQAPRPPFFLVANHLSYVDIILLAGYLECTFIAKSEISDWPGMGWLASGIGTIFIDRKNFQDIPRVIGLIDETLATGLGVILFPEGTSTMGEGVMPFSPALLEPAARAAYPVSYAAISYATPPNEAPAHAAICWWGDMEFAPHFLKLLMVSKFEATVVFGEDAIQADERKLLARALRGAVNQQFIPVV